MAEIIDLNKDMAAYMPPEAPPANAVTVVVAVDNNYVPHLAALIESIKEYFPQTRFLDFVVLDGGIHEINKKLLEKQFFMNFKNGSINYIDCKDLYKNIKTHAYFTEATFYRISIVRLLPNHKKVLYLDTDIIVLSDISELFDLTLGEKYIAAAAPDICMKEWIARGHKKTIPKRYKGFKGIVVSEYVKNHLGLGESAGDYFQAGVMLFDLENFKEADIEKSAITDLTENKYWLLDQDVLNKCLKERTLALDVSWNLVNGLEFFCKYMPDEWVQKTRRAFSNPKIVHYAGFDEKPWHSKSAPLAHYYWFFLRKTFWYEDILKKLESLKKKKSLFSFF